MGRARVFYSGEHPNSLDKLVLGFGRGDRVTRGYNHRLASPIGLRAGRSLFFSRPMPNETPHRRGDILSFDTGIRNNRKRSNEKFLIGRGSTMTLKKSRRSYSAVRAEQRLKELGIKLPAPPEPFGTYVEAVQTGNLLFLSGMLPTEGHGAKFIGRLGAELDVETARKAARLAALNVLAVARQHLGSLDKVTRVVRLGVSMATSGDVRDQPRVADAASELLQDGKRQEPLPPGVWRRQPSAWDTGRAGSHFRGGDLREAP
jgi:enamine deaminase RidA (YjgF/YER057c/UK114 family)